MQVHPKVYFIYENICNHFGGAHSYPAAPTCHFYCLLHTDTKVNLRSCSPWASLDREIFLPGNSKESYTRLFCPLSKSTHYCAFDPSERVSISFPCASETLKWNILSDFPEPTTLWTGRGIASWSSRALLPSIDIHECSVHVAVHFFLAPPLLWLSLLEATTVRCCTARFWVGWWFWVTDWSLAWWHFYVELSLSLENQGQIEWLVLHSTCCAFSGNTKTSLKFRILSLASDLFFFFQTGETINVDLFLTPADTSFNAA